VLVSKDDAIVSSDKRRNIDPESVKSRSFLAN
jgi:hypothetical protein